MAFHPYIIVYSILRIYQQPLHRKPPLLTGSNKEIMLIAGHTQASIKAW